jgi:2-polyprenyl-3-methyl-5-hydroxy-6-metoxy-1,4-benzoquinol methylase
MSIGSMARRVLGPRVFHFVARYYVRLFGDYANIAPVLIAALPRDARILDIGGGDGAPLNYLLQARPDISVTMIDIAPAIGGAIDESVRSRVTIMPETSIQDYREHGNEAPNTVLILDVMHHVPPDQREAFLRDLKSLVTRCAISTLVIKDVEPDGSLSAVLNYLADRYISGDRNVSPIGSQKLMSLLREHFSESISIVETPLFVTEHPHYALCATVS